MKKISVNLTNCYGIKQLSTVFNFQEHKRPYLIYAPNGVMKSSLAKVFSDIRTGAQSKDRIFPERPTRISVLDENQNPLTKESIFVIDHTLKQAENGRVSDLLVNATLKSKYDEAYSDIEKSKNALFKAVRSKIGRKEIEEEFMNTFGCKKSTLLGKILEIAPLVNGPEIGFTNVVFKEISNKNVEKFCATEKFRAHLKEYVNMFEKISKESRFFKNGFNHSSAKSVYQSLSDNGFFDATHAVTLRGESASEEANTAEQLQEILKTEKEKVLNHPALQERFELIDDEIKNADLLMLRHRITEDRAILPELDNMPEFKKKLWLSYFQQNLPLFNTLVTAYTSKKEVLEGVISAAKNEATMWKKTADIFNWRFHVPFKLKIENQEDVILNEETPTIIFQYTDNDTGDTKDLPRETLFESLSTGEQRALSILFIIFELESRKMSQTPTLVIVDDIADSFDYRNKYAIIEYLKETLNEPYFNGLILTHNFDFFRTIQHRLDLWGSTCQTAVRTPTEILLKSADRSNPFLDLKEAASTPTHDLSSIITLIPFVRNLVEYRKGAEHSEFRLLTEVLHIKENSLNIKISHLSDIFNDSIGISILQTNDSPVQEIIERLAENCVTNIDAIALKEKIILSIAIRLIAERFMLNNMVLPQNFNRKGNQTGRLTGHYKKTYPANTEQIKVLERVNLMTAENIHINSFMYEPLIDLSINHLVKLFDEVRNLTHPEETTTV